MAYPVPYVWSISGLISYSDGRPFNSGNIKAYDMYGGEEIQIGESGVNSDGSYQISFSSANFQRGDITREYPLIQLRVIDYQGMLIWKSIIISKDDAQQVFSFIIDEVIEIPDWKVQGNVYLKSGLPYISGTVEAYDKEGNNEYLLGSCKLNVAGYFEIIYSESMFQRGNKGRLSPNLWLRVFDESRNILVTYSVGETVSSNETVTINIPDSFAENNGDYLVYGQVTNHSGRPLSNVYVKVYCLDFNENTSINSGHFAYYSLNQEAVLTDRNGYYRIFYSPLSLPRLIQEPSTIALKEKISLYAKFAEKKENDPSEPEDSSSCWNYSNLIFDGSQKQEINFRLNRTSTTILSKFEDLDDVLRIYRMAIINEALYDHDELITSNYKKIQNFINSIFKFPLPIYREDLVNEDVQAYFNAYSFFFLIQEKMNLTMTDEELTFYTSCLFALGKKGITSFTSLMNEKAPDIQNMLLDGISTGLIASNTDINMFMTFWQSLQKTKEVVIESEEVFGIYQVLMLWEYGDIRIIMDNNIPKVELKDLGERAQKLLNKYYEAGNDIPRFLELVNPYSESNVDETEISEEDIILTSEEYERLTFIYDLSDFFEKDADSIIEGYKYAITQNPSIKTLKGMLSFNEANWSSLVVYTSTRYRSWSLENKLALPVTFPGTTSEEQINLYALKLQKLIKTWFPQNEVNNKLSELDENTYPEWKAIGIILNDPEWNTFSFDSMSLDEFLINNPSIQISDGDKDKIKTLQRLFRLTTDFDSVMYLIENSFESAYQIAQTIEDEFVADHHLGLHTMAKAQQIHRLACHYTSETSLQISKFHASLTEQNDTLPALARGVTEEMPLVTSINTSNIAPNRVESRIIANWKTLFGSLNRNAALKGQTVLSPSAYYMDLLEFLKGEGYKVLKNRRPDLWNLELSKENAETALPTIDIVIELLERLAEQSILSDLNYNTGSETTEALRAAPTYAGNYVQAYQSLNQAVFPMDLPRNFYAEKMTALLKNISLSVYDLVRTQRVNEGDYYYRYLRLSPVLKQALQLVVSDEYNSLIDVYDLWGLQENDNSVLCPDKSTIITGTWDEILSDASVFFDRSGLTMSELQSIITFPNFLNYNIQIRATSEAYQLGDISGFKIENINENFAREISCLVRLRRLTLWNLYDIALVLKEKLEDIDRICCLREITQASVSEIYSWVYEMPDEHFNRVFPYLPEIPENCSAEMYRNLLLETAAVSFGTTQKDLEYAFSREAESFTQDVKSDLQTLYRIYTFAKRLNLSVQKFELFRLWLDFDLNSNWTFETCVQMNEVIKDLFSSPLDAFTLLSLAFPIAPKEKTLALEYITVLRTEMIDLGNSAREEQKEELLRLFPDVVEGNQLTQAPDNFVEIIYNKLSEYASRLGVELPESVLVLLPKIHLNDIEMGIIKGWLVEILGFSYSDLLDETFDNSETENEEQETNGWVWGEDFLLWVVYASALKDTIIESLTSKFGITSSTISNYLDGYLKKIDTNEAARTDWLELAISEDFIDKGVSAYFRFSKAILIYKYTQIENIESLDLISYSSLPVEWVEYTGSATDWSWENYPCDFYFENLSSLSYLEIKNFNESFIISTSFDKGLWIYNQLSKDYVLSKWNINTRQLDDLLISFEVDSSIGIIPISDTEEWCRLCRLWKIYRKTTINATTIETLISDDQITNSEEMNNYQEAVEFLSDSLRKMRGISAWQEFITPVSDSLRQARRDALVRYICHSSQSDNSYYPQSFFDANDLYSYYLIDVEMEPDMSISRIRQALNSIQQFVQRSELGLEGSFVLTDEQRANWEWMKNYRVWEANRKVFLYAENWIESDLRDDKSPFFKELEEQIQQVGNDPDAMNTALGEYLEKMNASSGVEILGACKEDGGGAGVLYTLHIIGRTKGEPHRFYMRRYKAKALYSGEWEPWEALDIDIKAEVVIPVLLNQRLYLLWPSFVISKKEDGAESSGKTDLVNQVEVRLNWTYYDGRKWSGVKITKNSIFDIYARERDLFLEDGEKIDYRYHFQAVSGSSEYVQINMFRTHFKDESHRVIEDVVLGTDLQSSKSKVKVVRNKEIQYIMETGSFQLWVDGKDSAFLAAEVNSKRVDAYPPLPCYLERNCWVEKEGHVCGNNGLNYPIGSPILEKTPGIFRLLPINFAFYSGYELPFFYMDSQRTFMVFEVPGTTPESQTEYRFELLSHPLVGEFYKRFRDGGEEFLFSRETQALPVSDSYYYTYSYYNYYFSVYLGYYIAGDWEAWDLGQNLFINSYRPIKGKVSLPYPVPMIDFSFGNPNSIYNWELFFHLPMLLASKMYQEQNYEEALKWYRMIFDPRLDLTKYEITKRWSRRLPKGARFWQFLPFFANKNADDSILETLSKPTERDLLPNVISLRSLVDKWKDDPFNPHLIGRYRMAAYQKNVVMKYLDNLIAWADELFTQDTMESVNEAIQLYILAAEVLGPRNAEASDVTIPQPINVKEFLLRKEGAISNVYVKIEDSLISTRVNERNMSQRKITNENKSVTDLFSSIFYFSIPRNDKLMEYWNTVSDRLYKIRNSMNIEGVKRTLALYEPPIDPAMLIKAKAAGLSIADALSEASSPLPLYRFQTMIQKATEITHELQSLSSNFLSALEKNDSETLSLMRTQHEQELLSLSKSVKSFQIKELESQLDSLLKSKEVTEIRYNFYKNIEKISTKETLSLVLQDVATISDVLSMGLKMGSSASTFVPDFSQGALVNGFGGPFISMTSFGGEKTSSSMIKWSEGLQIAASLIRQQANQIQQLAGYERRWEEWKLQEKLAAKELESLNRQIVASEIRISMAEKEVENLERQIEQMDEIYDFMINRFTNRDLYSWMVTHLGQLHSSFFKLAMKLAKRAEVCYRFELGLKDTDTNFIKSDYWDGLRKGLLAGERLLLDLRTMEASYLEKNKRELEITRAVSLSLIDSGALFQLQTEGSCDFALPEVLFDMDFPGQKFRRIRGVSVELHCNASSGMGVHAKLSMTSNRIRTESIDKSNGNHYLPNRIGVTTIASSQAEAYAGVFNFDFRDERYLPFEGAGVDSSWHLELPKDFRQFDYETISDVILHISYTARNGGVSGSVKDKISQEWGQRETSVRLSTIDSGALKRLQNGEEITVEFSSENFPAIARQEGSIIKLDARCRYKAQNDQGVILTITYPEDAFDFTFENSTETSLWSGKTEIWNSLPVNGAENQSSFNPEVVSNGYSIKIKVKEGSDASCIQNLLFIHQYTLKENNTNSET